MSNSSAHSLCYWNEALLDSKLPHQRRARYILFDVDLGGLNNIRLVFEYVAVLAAMTGRTLVLPPKSPWYLLNYGPMPEEHKGGNTEFGDLFDIPALKQAIPVLTTDEFVDEASQHLGIPEHFSDQLRWQDQAAETGDIWKQWLLENTEIPDWNPHDTVVCMPDIEAASGGPHLTGPYLDERQPVEFSVRMEAAPVLYFPSNADHRSLGPVGTMLAGKDETIPMLGRRFLKHHVRFRRDIFELAERILDRLELGVFDAMQVRRNDFQYTETQISTETICNNTKALFDRGLPIYIATDEERTEIFEQLSAGLNAPRIVRWKDVEAVVDEPIPFIWVGVLEQMICSAARRFVGTDFSTFTAYIHRLRGYLLANDQSLYFHRNHYPEVPEPTLAEHFSGRDYLRENPLLWLAC